MLRAIMAPQRVKMKELGSALQTWEEMVYRCNKKNTTVGEVEHADDIKCSAVELMVLDNLERHLQLHARRLKNDDDVRSGICAESNRQAKDIVKAIHSLMDTGQAVVGPMSVHLKHHQRQMQKRGPEEQTQQGSEMQRQSSRISGRCWTDARTRSRNRIT